jgi:hypothetical protein
MSGDFMHITQRYVSHLTMETVFMLRALTGGKGWATGAKESMSSEIDEVLKLATSANYLKGKRHDAGWKMKITMLIKQISDARDNEWNKEEISKLEADLDEAIKRREQTSRSTNFSLINRSRQQNCYRNL